MKQKDDSGISRWQLEDWRSSWGQLLKNKIIIYQMINIYLFQKQWNLIIFEVDQEIASAMVLLFISNIGCREKQTKIVNQSSAH